MIITLTTDFGLGEYVGAMKGAILSIDPSANIVDISHDVMPGDLTQGAFILYSIVPHFPQAVHVAVIDPGVGTERRGLAIKCGRSVLIGPDNGVLIPAAKRLGIEAVYELANRDFFNASVSPTFHGRDVFGPVAAHISKGERVSSVGPEVHEWVGLDFGTFKASAARLEGKVLFIDRFGNLVTNITGEAAIKTIGLGGNANLRIRNRLLKVELVKSYGFGNRGKPLLTVSSAGFLELAIRERSAKSVYRAKEGDKVSIRPVPTRKGISK